MSGKCSAVSSTRVADALNRLSKNALIDLVYDRACLETGYADDAADEDVAKIIQGWLIPITSARGDRPIDLLGLMAARDVPRVPPRQIPFP